MSVVHPFEVAIPEAALQDLQARLDATRWIEDVYEADWDCGAPLPFVKALCQHWRTRFDWRALEARINAVPNVTTEIEGMTIHSVHLRSKRPDAVPLLLLHGWPGSFLEFLDLWEPFADPPSGEPAFHVIVPSLPGYGFSTTKPGVSPQRAATIMGELMERLGYDRYMVQGGDWGSMVGTEVARQFPDNVLGLHLNCVNGSAPPDPDNYDLTPEEKVWASELNNYLTYPHLFLQMRKPVSVTYAMNDSPAGLAAWIGEKMHDWADNRGRADTVISFDTMLATIALYWFTETIASSARFYYELGKNPPVERYVGVPTAGAIFPDEVAKLPRVWAERHYNITHWTVFDRGGHFAAMEVPDLLIGDVRSFARTLVAAAQ